MVKRKRTLTRILLLVGLILLVLALTSTRGWKRRLGRNWKRVHRLVYLAGILAVLHFAWLVKDIGEPLRYAAIITLLLVLRIPRLRQAASNTRHKLKTAWRPQADSGNTT